MKYGFVKCGVYTPEIKVADVDFNAESIIRGIKEASARGIEVLVFPELSLTGYTCGDLFSSDALLTATENALIKIAQSTRDYKSLIFVGAPICCDGAVFDVAAAISDGAILGFVPKTDLSAAERRFFAPADEQMRYKRLSGAGVFADDIDGEMIPLWKNLIFDCAENADLKIGAEIGTDALLPCSPAVSHVDCGATMIVNLTADFAAVGKKERRENNVKSISERLKCAYLVADAGKGESTTDEVFCGHNLIAENGIILAESEMFSTGLTESEADVKFIAYERRRSGRVAKAEKCLFIGFSVEEENAKAVLTRKFKKTPFVPEENGELSSRAELIVNIQSEGVIKRIEHTHAKAVVIGLSGGLDSTLSFLVAVSAMKKLKRSVKDVIAVTMPCFGTTSRTYLNTLKLAKDFGATLKKIDIGKAVYRHLKDIKHEDGVYDAAYENAQARERTQVLMDLANMYGGFVLGTGDLSETALGWSTYNGDHMCNYNPNCTVPKTLIRHIVKRVAEKSKGKLRNVLNDILSTPVSPELLPPTEGNISQKTEDIVGPYELHDFFLYNFIRRGYTPDKILFVAEYVFKGIYDKKIILGWLKIFVKRFFSQQFKRSCSTDGVRVGSVDLSPRGGLVMPSDAVSSAWLKLLDNM